MTAFEFLSSFLKIKLCTLSCIDLVNLFFFKTSTAINNRLGLCVSNRMGRKNFKFYDVFSATGFNTKFFAFVAAR